MCNPVQEIENTGKGVEKLVQSTATRLENIARDPLPVIQTIALTYALGPAGAGLSAGSAALVTSAAISAANGGRVEDIALNMAAAYAGSQIGEYAGASMPPETTAMVKQVVTSASASAATTALRGGDFNQILASGVSGSVNGYVANSLKEQGFTNVDNKLITNAATAATSAILNGRSVSDALSQSVTATLLTAAIQGQVDQLNKNNELGQSLATKADSLAKEADTFFNKNFAPGKVNVLRDAQVSAKELNFQIDTYNRGVAGLEFDASQYNRYAAIANQDPNNVEAVTLANAYANSYAERSKQVEQQALTVEYRKSDYDKISANFNSVVDKYTTQYAAPLKDLNTQYETLVAQTTELSTSLADNVFKYQEELKLGSNDLIKQIGQQALEDAVEEATKLLTPPVAEVPPAESETPVTDTVATTDEPLPPYEPEPVPVEPEPVPVEPEPTPVEPEPTPVEPEPVEPEPVEPEPTPVEPEPVPVEPEPVPVEPVQEIPEIEVVAPREPVEPEPTPVEPEPVPVEPAPVTPTPVTPEPDQDIPEIVITAPREPKEPESEFDVLLPPTPTTPTPTTPTPVTPKPVTPTPVIPKPVTPAPVTPKPATPAAQTGGLDMAALMALLASMGGNVNQQAPTPPPTVDIGEQLDLGAPLETNPFAKPQTQTKMAQGGSIDDLLALLRRG
jgi:F0F1-type ATP synthase membrane subunit b/b'